jgi:hypothetical protein
MPVLILAVAAGVLFFGIVGLLWLADRLESRRNRSDNAHSSQPTPQPFLSLDQAFDPIFAVLWEAPAAGLQLIGSGTATGTAAVRLLPIFRQAARRFPEIYDGHSFVQWLQTLQEAQLIAWKAHGLVLTQDGHSFLKSRFVKRAVSQMETGAVPEWSQ